MQSDRFAAPKCHDRVATGIIRQTDISEAGNAIKSDKINFVRSDVEMVNNVIADRLSENEEIIRTAPVSVSSPDKAKTGEPGA